MTLPASQVRVVVPLVQYEMAASDPSGPRRGIIPDYPFQPTIQQLLDKNDAEMEYVMNLIRQERQKAKAAGVADAAVDADPNYVPGSVRLLG